MDHHQVSVQLASGGNQASLPPPPPSWNTPLTKGVERNCAGSTCLEVTRTVDCNQAVHM